MSKAQSFFSALMGAICLIVLFAAAAQAQTGKNLIINNFVSDPANIETHVVISDVDGIGPNIKISIFSEDGRLIYERYERLNPFGKLNYNPLTYLNAYQHGFNQNPVFHGTLRIESDGGNLIGQYWEMHKDSKKGYMNIAVPAADGDGYDKLVCQHFVSDKSIESELIIANAEATRPVSVNVKFYSDNGGMVAQDNYIIQANGIRRISPFKATKQTRMTGTAYVVVVGAGKITGEYWQGAPEERYQIALPLEGVTKIR
jgi:hypothetical protein